MPVHIRPDRGRGRLPEGRPRWCARGGGEILYGGQVELGICVDHQTARSVAGTGAQPELLAKAMPVIATNAYDPSFAPW